MPASKSKTDNEPDFASLMSELEEIVAWFEGEQQVDLDASVQRFERGMTVAEELKTRLQAVENRVKKIQEQFDR